MEEMEKQRIQTKLRKVDPNISKHLQKVEDFSSEVTNREAYRRARSLGHLKYIYNGKITSTRLETEGHTEHLDAMLINAKKHLGPTVIGMPGEIAGMGGAPTELGGPMAMAELRKINIEEFSKLITEELTNVYLRKGSVKINKNTLKNLVAKELHGWYGTEIVNESLNEQRPKDTGETAAGRKIMRARAWMNYQTGERMPRLKWPFMSNPNFWAGEAQNNGNRATHKASFVAFYKEVLKDPDAMKLMRCRNKRCSRWRGGGFDYHWGDQHARAYAHLNKRGIGRTQVTGAEAEEIQTGVAGPGRATQKIDPETGIRSDKYTGAGGGQTEKTELIRKYQIATRKAETYRNNIKKWGAQHTAYHVQWKKDYRNRKPGVEMDISGWQKDPKHKKILDRISSAKKQVAELEKLALGYKANIDKLDVSTQDMEKRYGADAWAIIKSHVEMKGLATNIAELEGNITKLKDLLPTAKEKEKAGYEEAIKTYQEQVEQAKTRLNNLFSKQKIEPTAAGVRATEMSKADIQRNILKIRREIRRASPNMRAIMKRRLKALRAQLKRAQ